MNDNARGIARWATLAIVTIAAVRCLVVILPQVRFDTDPAVNPDAFAGLGPAASFLLDAILFAASALGLVAESRSGRGVHGWLVACALVPGVAVMWHGIADAIDLFRGATWLSAAMALVATAHLARDPVMRRLIVAGCVAVAIPLMLRGFEQIVFDHANTVKYFDDNKDEIISGRGWQLDSPAAQQFERRLRQLEASGWFGLANLFSATMAFGTLALGGFGIAALRRRNALGPVVLLVAVCCAVLLAINGSKGSLASTLLGAGVGAVALWRPRLAGPVALAVIALAACAPALRGLLPEGFIGEKSLLFRWQYLQGAIAALPESLPFGLGPNGFQNAYLRLKPPRSPEDVVSAHAMVVDWVLLVGPLSIAWVALVVRGFLGGDATANDDRDEVIATRAGVIVAGCVLAAQAVADASVADAVWIAFRVGGAVALVIGFRVIDSLQRALPASIVRAALLAAVVAVFAQAQVEMLLFQPGAVVWAMVALGAVMRLPAGEANPRVAWTSAAACAVLSLTIVLYGLAPQLKQDRLLDQAAQRVACIADVREQWPKAMKEIASGTPGSATKHVVDAVYTAAGVEMGAMVKAATTSSNDIKERISATIQALQRFDANQRARAAETLALADAAYPENDTALDAAVKQLTAAGRRTTGIGDFMLHAAAIEAAREGALRFGGAKFPARLADLWIEEARARQDPPTFNEATKAVRVAIERQPRAARFHADLGDLLAAQGNIAGAIDAYRAALAIDKDLELDIMAQLNERQRKDLESRLQRVERAQQGEALPKGWPYAER